MRTGYKGSRGCVIFIILAVLRSSVSESNVATLGTAQQSSSFDNRWLAEQAVDGCVQTTITSGCCSHTYPLDHKTVWWRVDLKALITINAITIYYRDNSHYKLAGYQLYVSNTTSSPQDGILCYQDTSTTLAAVQLTITHQCPYVGRYVTVYNYRNTLKRYHWYYDYAILELCEVQVWGCLLGTYGDGNCDSVCSGDCYGGNCNATTGACFYCFTGSYGELCNKICPLSCKDNKCEKDSGNCYDCIPQKHGVQCEHDCSMDCKDRLCDKVTGHCFDCIAQKHGDQCEHDCSVDCKDRLCEKDTGHCYDCNARKHGVQCEHDCSVDCKDRLCDKDTGHCYECVTGRYGATCELICGDGCKDECDKVTGNCIECIDGRHGLKCELDCPANCKGNCDQVTAHCFECIAGKQGNRCDINCPIHCPECNKVTGQCTVCIAGRYGVGCTSTCPVTCKDFVCDKETGHCLECYPGKYGIVCGADCPESCKDGICNKEDGHCLTTESPITEHSSDSPITGHSSDSPITEHSPGDTKDIIIAVLSAVCGLFVVATIIIIVKHIRLKKDKEKNSTNKGTDQSDQDTGYTSIDQRQVEPSHIYEMDITPHE